MLKLTPEHTFFKENAKGGLCSLSLEVPADLETPVSAFLKLRSLGANILLESVERGERVGRYSVIGVGALLRLTVEAGQCRFTNGEEVERFPISQLGGPLEIMRYMAEKIKLDAVDHHIPFLTGAIGYISYDTVRNFEQLPDTSEDTLKLPDIHLELPESLVVFDHAKRKATIATLVDTGDNNSQRYEVGAGRLSRLSKALLTKLPEDINDGTGSRSGPPRSNITREEFEEMVRRGKEYIQAGDVFQVVLSQRLEGDTTAEPIQIYRALRMLNPSPYMFYLDFGRCQMIGSSPEALVTLTGDTARVRPIAGTRPRGATPEEDRLLTEELIHDEKEKAEHVMLVDLGRNDLGRVCSYGTVRVPELMKVEYYSHVMHLVSTVEGKLADGRDKFDLLRATFPAGTVTGAPKIRAMEIIEELEGVKRGPYAGSVGYFDLRGNMDMCITIRTIVIKDGRYYLQAGAGIVYDSVPEREYEETLDKLRALARAIEIAEEGFR
ncbi:MAG: anthranilate synthase component I [Candidatus Glassbacteria bacterium]